VVLGYTRGVEPAGRGPGGVWIGQSGREGGPAGAQVGGGLAGRFLGCVVGEARVDSGSFADRSTNDGGYVEDIMDHE
jgi:hypothetical protein